MADVDFELLSDPSEHALVFSIAEQNFAIAADFIEQIVELPRIFDVPSADSALLGLADHAGHPIPVVDIAPFLNLDADGVDDFRHGLLVNHNGLRIMLAIEAVVVLRELAGEPDVKVPPQYQSAGFVERCCEMPMIDYYPGQGVSEVEADGETVTAPQSQAVRKRSRKVVVLNVPQLLIAVQSAASARSAS